MQVFNDVSRIQMNGNTVQSSSTIAATMIATLRR